MQKLKKTEAIAFSLDDLTYRQALTIGLFQCLAVYPGFSRAGSTISGGLLAKVHYKAASEFSFRIAIDSYKSHIIKTIFKLEYRFFIYLTSSITHFNMA